MADNLTKAQRSKCMAAIRGKDTKPELVVRNVLQRLGYRFGLHSPSLPGKPDLVFCSRRAVVLVHGCYWHSHSCKRGRSAPYTNAEFWQQKRSATRNRDRRALSQLRRLGWRVLTIWECQLRDAERLRERIVKFLESGRISRA